MYTRTRLEVHVKMSTHTHVYIVSGSQSPLHGSLHVRHNFADFYVFLATHAVRPLLGRICPGDWWCFRVLPQDQEWGVLGVN